MLAETGVRQKPSLIDPHFLGKDAERKFGDGSTVFGSFRLIMMK